MPILEVIKRENLVGVCVVVTRYFGGVLLGTGGIDYKTLMREIAKLPQDTPAMLEHLHTEAEYDMAAEAAVKFAQSVGMRREGMVWVK